MVHKSDVGLHKERHNSKIPQHIGIIMDGNRRWAKEKGLPTLAGHQAGYDRAQEIVEHAFSRGVSYVTLFAFSSENWNRTKSEVTYLLRLLRKMINEQAQRLHQKGMRLRIIGSRVRLSSDIVMDMERAEALTRKNTKGTVVIAFNYGGRQEIVDAIRSLCQKTPDSTSISDKDVRTHLYANDVPDPDLIIRTSGEQRLSGFMLWQSAYSELYFTKTYWPAFTSNALDRALDEYARRQRRYGS